MTLNDVAARLGVSKRTVMRWADDGRFPLPFIRDGRDIQWRDEDVQRWLREQRKVVGEKNGRTRRSSRPARS
jgi:excisionase family DNA binding protein